MKIKGRGAGGGAQPQTTRSANIWRNCNCSLFLKTFWPLYNTALCNRLCLSPSASGHHIGSMPVIEYNNTESDPNQAISNTRNLPIPTFPVADLHSKILDAPRPNFFNFMQFLGKFEKILCLRPPGGLAPPPRGNPGPATSFVITFYHWANFLSSFAV